MELEKKESFIEILGQKQDQALLSMSPEEIEQRIKELEQ